MHTVNRLRTQLAQIRIIITPWTLRIQLILVLVVQMSLFVLCFHWKIHKCNLLERLRKPREVLKWAYIMQLVIGLKKLCKYFRIKQLGCMYLIFYSTYCIWIKHGVFSQIKLNNLNFNFKQYILYCYSIIFYNLIIIHLL